MTTAMPEASSPSVGRLRMWLAVSGLMTVVSGVVIMLWPEATAQVITLILACYAVIGGVIYLGAGLFSAITGWARVGHILTALVFIAAGIFAFINPARSATLIGAIVVGFIAAAWILEGFAALASLSVAPAKGWSVLFAVVSIVAGIALLVAPLFAASLMLFWIGAVLVVLGVVGIIRALLLGRL